ncbi:MAG: rhodanese-like domain-containing protein [Ferrovibrio sp.]
MAVAMPALADDAPTAITGTTTVNAEQVVDLVTKKSNLVILDNRKPEDYAAGHIEGAVRLIDTDVNAESLAKAVKTKDTPVLFYCNGLKCGRAAKAAAVAVQQGYKEVYYYALGLDEWNKKGLPLIK